MILAAGLTPAWQQILVFDQFSMGEVNRAAQAHWCASGKSVNVALALAALGAETASLSLAGGAAGARLKHDLAGHVMAADWVETASATRVCTTIVDRRTGTTTELVENAAPISDAEMQAFEAAYERLAARAGAIVLSGSLPPGAEVDSYRRLMAMSATPVILDARGPELDAALAARPLLVKPNREELARTVNRSIDSDRELIAAARGLIERGARHVLVTQGAGAVWLVTEREARCSRPPHITAVNAIGSGDCLAAGCAWSIARGDDMLTAARIGMAAAIENALALLPARIDPQRVLERAGTIEFARTSED
jgi:1-phosphofructokinase family hexose kinase